MIFVINFLLFEWEVVHLLDEISIENEITNGRKPFLKNQIGKYSLIVIIVLS